MILQCKTGGKVGSAGFFVCVKFYSLGAFFQDRKNLQFKYSWMVFAHATFFEKNVECPGKMPLVHKNLHLVGKQIMRCGFLLTQYFLMKILSVLKMPPSFIKKFSRGGWK